MHDHRFCGASGGVHGPECVALDRDEQADDVLPVAETELRAARDGFGARIAPAAKGAAGCDGEVAAGTKHGCAARERLGGVATSLRRVGGEDQVGAAGGVGGDTCGEPPPLLEEVGSVRRQQLR